MDNPHFNLDDIAEVLENIHKAKKLGILIDSGTAAHGVVRRTGRYRGQRVATLARGP